MQGRGIFAYEDEMQARLKQGAHWQSGIQGLSTLSRRRRIASQFGSTCMARGSSSGCPPAVHGHTSTNSKIRNTSSGRRTLGMRDVDEKNQDGRHASRTVERSRFGHSQALQLARSPPSSRQTAPCSMTRDAPLEPRQGFRSFSSCQQAAGCTALTPT